MQSLADFRPNALQQPWSVKAPKEGEHNKIHLAYPVESHKADWYTREVPD